MMMYVPEMRFIRLILSKTVSSHSNEIKVPDILQYIYWDTDWL
jgi:hypothetical protein